MRKNIRGYTLIELLVVCLIYLIIWALVFGTTMLWNWLMPHLWKSAPLVASWWNIIGYVSLIVLVLGLAVIFIRNIFK